MVFQQIHISRKLSHFLTIVCVTAIFPTFSFLLLLLFRLHFVLLLIEKIQDFRYEKINTFYLLRSVDLIAFDCPGLSVGENHTAFSKLI